MVRSSIGAAGITTSSTTASSPSAHVSAGMSASAAAPAAPPSAARREACRLSLIAAPLLLHARSHTRQQAMLVVRAAPALLSTGGSLRSLSKPRCRITTTLAMHIAVTGHSDEAVFHPLMQSRLEQCSRLDRSPAWIVLGSSWATASLVWYASRRVGSAAGLHPEGAGCIAALYAGAHPGLAEAASPSALATASGTVVRTVGRRCCGTPALVGASTRVDIRHDIVRFHSSGQRTAISRHNIDVDVLECR